MLVTGIKLPEAGTITKKNRMFVERGEPGKETCSAGTIERNVISRGPRQR